jgi:hypothetical protein
VLVSAEWIIMFSVTDNPTIFKICAVIHFLHAKNMSWGGFYYEMCPLHPKCNEWRNTETAALIPCSEWWTMMTRKTALHNFRAFTWISISRGSIVRIATAYRLDDIGFRVRVLVGSRILTSPYCLDRLWGPPNLSSNGYGGRRPFPGGKAEGLQSWPLTSN